MTLREFAIRTAAALRLGRGARERPDLAEELRFHQEMLEARHRDAATIPRRRGAPRGSSLAARRNRRDLARSARACRSSTRSCRTSATGSACCGARPGSPPPR